MCCCSCCSNKKPDIKVGDRVHDRVSDSSPTVRINGAMTITVEYLGKDVAVVSIKDRLMAGRFSAERACSREDFDATYSLCRCDPQRQCTID